MWADTDAGGTPRAVARRGKANGFEDRICLRFILLWVFWLWWRATLALWRWPTAVRGCSSMPFVHRAMYWVDLALARKRRRFVLYCTVKLFCPVFTCLPPLAYGLSLSLPTTQHSLAVRLWVFALVCGLWVSSGTARASLCLSQPAGASVAASPLSDAALDPDKQGVCLGATEAGSGVYGCCSEAGQTAANAVLGADSDLVGSGDGVLFGATGECCAEAVRQFFCTIHCGLGNAGFVDAAFFDPAADRTVLPVVIHPETCDRLYV